MQAKQGQIKFTSLKYSTIGVFLIICPLASQSVNAISGDVYEKGVPYCASTYSNHPVYGDHDKYFLNGGGSVDINTSSDNNNPPTPIYAPENGIVTVVKNSGPWGNSITWKGANDELHMAHLNDFGETGLSEVGNSGYFLAGTMIGRVGNTGFGSGPHLHIQSKNGTLNLSGRNVDTPGCYTSDGSLDPKITMTCVSNICWTPKTDGSLLGCWDATNVYLENSNKTLGEVTKNYCQIAINSLDRGAQAVSESDSNESIPNDVISDEAGENPIKRGFWRKLFTDLFSLFSSSNASLNYKIQAASSALGEEDFVRNYTVQRTFAFNESGVYEEIDSRESPLGNGYRRSSEESANQSLPDFIVSRVELQKSGVGKYKYLANTSVDAVAWIKNIGDANWGPDEDGVIHDEIEIRYYLSNGYKEDSHSDWEHTGSEIIQRYNLELVDDAKKETDGFTTPSEVGVYNIVVCADRTKDSGNKDGDVLEKHKSNNCSTEAVFEVVEYDLDIFDFHRAHNPIYATGGKGYDNFEARFKIKNNARKAQTIDDMRIDAYKNGSFVLTCWTKGESITISADATEGLSKEFCEIAESGNYHLEAKLKINGVWRTHQTHPSFTVYPPLNIEVLEFYQQPEPIYATNADGTKNFYARLKFKNTASVPAIFNEIKFEAYYNGVPKFSVYEKLTPTTIEPEATIDTGHVITDIWDAGEYQLKLNGHIGSAVGWKTFAEFPKFRVVPRGTTAPDLHVTAVSLGSTNLVAGESTSYSATIKNSGTASSSVTTVRFKLSADNTIDHGDSDLKTRSISNLSANGESTVSGSTLVMPLASGTYWVGVCVDTVVSESAILNNCSNAVQIVITDPVNPDLELSEFELFPNYPFHAEVYSGARFVMYLDHEYIWSVRTKNVGSDTSPETNLKIRFVSGANESVVFSNSHISLAPGSTWGFEAFPVNAPNQVGEHSIEACLDKAGTTEINIENNCESIDVLVRDRDTLGSPDVYEDDNTSDLAKTITSGQTQRHSLVPYNDIDWIRFEVDEEATTIISLKNSTNAISAFVYDNNFNRVKILYADLAQPDSYTFKASSGVYYIVVNASNSSQTAITEQYLVSIKSLSGTFSVAPLIKLLLD